MRESDLRKKINKICPRPDGLSVNRTDRRGGRYCRRDMLRIPCRIDIQGRPKALKSSKKTIFGEKKSDKSVKMYCFYTLTRICLFYFGRKCSIIYSVVIYVCAAYDRDAENDSARRRISDE